MSLNEELKKDADLSKIKIAELLQQLESFQEIKSNLSSSNSGLKNTIESLDSLVTSVNSIAESLESVTVALKKTSENLAGFDDLLEKIKLIEASNEKINEKIIESNNDVANKLSLLNDSLVDKIKKSTLLGRLTIK